MHHHHQKSIVPMISNNLVAPRAFIPGFGFRHGEQSPTIDTRHMEEFFAFGQQIALNPQLSSSPKVEEALTKFRMSATNIGTPLEEVIRTKEMLLMKIIDIIGEKEAAILQSKVMKQSDIVQAAFLKKSAVGLKSAFYLSSTGIDEIMPGLFISGCLPTTNAHLLRSKDITHICSCNGMLPRFLGQFTYLILQADDLPTYDIKKYFNDAYHFIEEGLSGRKSERWKEEGIFRNGLPAGVLDSSHQKHHTILYFDINHNKNDGNDDSRLHQTTGSGGVLVHCGAGISRAPTIFAAYLIKKMNVSASMAITIIRKARPCACPNDGFRVQLLQWEEEMSKHATKTATVHFRKRNDSSV